MLDSAGLIAIALKESIDCPRGCVWVLDNGDHERINGCCVLCSSCIDHKIQNEDNRIRAYFTCSRLNVQNSSIVCNNISHECKIFKYVSLEE